MKILMAHNFYQQGGGEDSIFSTEADMLESYGHNVVRFAVKNDKIEELDSLTLAKNTIWNSQVYQQIRSLIQKECIQIAHFHNTFPLISPAAYHAVKAEGIPVIQTLHNYRLLCPNALFFRDGKVCEDCLGQPLKLPGILHGCYRNNRTASAAVAIMVGYHSVLGTWSTMVDTYIAYSKFALHKLIQGGLPANKLRFKTNFLHPAPEIGYGKGNYALFVGRLSPEKGLNTLLNAWKNLSDCLPLKIVGDGPLAPEVAQASQRLKQVEWLGRKSLDEVYELMGDATCLIFCSEWYETFGRVAIESFAKGTPVVAAKIGAIAELVEHGRTGVHFHPGDAEDLASQVKWLISNSERLSQMRQATRQEFEEKYTAEANYRRLMEIYTAAIKNNHPC